MRTPDAGSRHSGPKEDDEQTPENEKDDGHESKATERRYAAYFFAESIGDELNNQVEKYTHD